MDVAENNQTKFKIPDGFEEEQLDCTDDPDGVLRRLDSDDVQLWLIQTPSDVDLKDFDRVKVVMSEEPTSCKLKGSTRKFEVVAKESDPLKTSGYNSTVVMKVDDDTKNLTPVNKFIHGHLSILDCVSAPEYDLPDVHVRKKIIPEGLRQRFVPFGAVTVLKSVNQEDNVKSKRHKKSKRNWRGDCKTENVSGEFVADETFTTAETPSPKRRKATRLEAAIVMEEIKVDDEVGEEDKCVTVVGTSEGRRMSSKLHKNKKEVNSPENAPIKLEIMSPKAAGDSGRKSRRSRH